MTDAWFEQFRRDWRELAVRLLRRLGDQALADRLALELAEMDATEGKG